MDTKTGDDLMAAIFDHQNIIKKRGDNIDFSSIVYEQAQKIQNQILAYGKKNLKTQKKKNQTTTEDLTPTAVNSME